MKLTLKMPDGAVFELDANVVAEDYARYYSENHDEPGMTFDDYKAECLGSGEDAGSTAIDWLQNEMSWEQLQPHLVKVQEPIPCNYAEEWVDADIKIKE